MCTPRVYGIGVGITGYGREARRARGMLLSFFLVHHVFYKGAVPSCIIVVLQARRYRSFHLYFKRDALFCLTICVPFIVARYVYVLHVLHNSSLFVRGTIARMDIGLNWMEMGEGSFRREGSKVHGPSRRLEGSRVSGKEENREFTNICIIPRFRYAYYVRPRRGVRRGSPPRQTNLRRGARPARILTATPASSAETIYEWNPLNKYIE